MRRRAFVRPSQAMPALFAAVWLGLLTAFVPLACAADSALDLAVAQARRLVIAAGTVVLAADASQEGHWTFVNGAGEKFTAATPDASNSRMVRMVR